MMLCKTGFGLGDVKTSLMQIALGYFDESKQWYHRLERKDYAEFVREV